MEKTIVLGRRIASSSRRSVRKPTSRFAFSNLKKRDMIAKLNNYEETIGALPRRKDVKSTKEWVEKYQDYSALVSAYETRYGS